MEEKINTNYEYLTSIIENHSDPRCALDPITKLTKYHTSYELNLELIQFSSSTANSVSELSFMRLEYDFPKLDTNLSTKIRIVLKKIFHLEEDVRVILTRSGTDAELILLGLLNIQSNKRITNIISSISEIGSGIKYAAQAGNFHDAFNESLAESIKKISGFENILFKLVEIPLRDQLGIPLDESIVDEMVLNQILLDIELGNHIILHITECSKTGLSGPSIPLALSLIKKYPTQVTVVVDSCQLRTSFKQLKFYLSMGFLVILTGSKFFGAPPFCGAILLPNSIQIQENLPLGLSNFSSKDDWPRSLQSITKNLNSFSDLGLYARWKVALGNMCEFSRIKEDDIYELTTRFLNCFQLLDFQYLKIWIESQHQNNAWGGRGPLANTIANIELILPQYFTSDQAYIEVKNLHYLLTIDCTYLESEGNVLRTILSEKYLLGQPVKLSDIPVPRYVLRISLSAEDFIKFSQNKDRSNLNILTKTQSALMKLNYLIHKLYY